MSQANISTHSDGETTCCYAKSEKSWVEDPNGIAWEAYHTMEDAQMLRRRCGHARDPRHPRDSGWRVLRAETGECCMTMRRTRPDAADKKVS